MNPEQVRKDAILAGFGSGWGRCNQNVNDFPEYLMHKVLVVQKSSKNAVSPHHLCCTLHASFAHLSNPPLHSILPPPRPEGVRWEAGGIKLEPQECIRWEACRFESIETKGSKNVEQALQLLLNESVSLENIVKRQKNIEEFYWGLGSSCLEMKVRKSEKKRGGSKGDEKKGRGQEAFVLGMRGLVRCTNNRPVGGDAGGGVEQGGQNMLFGWTAEREMVLMDWQSEPFLSAAVLNALKQHDCGISEKKAKQIIKDNFSSFSPKNDLIEVVGDRKKMEIEGLSTAFGVASGNLEIIETNFEVVIGGKSKGNYHSLCISSTKPRYLSEFSEHLFRSLDITSSNTSLVHFLTSLKEGKQGETEEEGKKGVEVLVMESEEEEEEGFERCLEEPEEGEVIKIFGSTS